MKAFALPLLVSATIALAGCNKVTKVGDIVIVETPSRIICLKKPDIIISCNSGDTMISVSQVEDIQKSAIDNYKAKLELDSEYRNKLNGNKP